MITGAVKCCWLPRVRPDFPEQGVLETANSIFKRFRNAFMSQSVNEDLKHSQQFVEPLLTTLQVSVSS